MIKNQKQAEASRRKLLELEQAKKLLEAETTNKQSSKYRIGISSFSNLISELKDELNTYDSLVEGNWHSFKPESLNEISDILISARLAQKMSQKDLADILGLKEQQIQRYEVLNYETASWPRIIEVATALNLKFYFEKILIINPTNESEIHFDAFDEFTEDEIELAKKKIKKNPCLMIN